jgi:hypothetical protein
MKLQTTPRKRILVQLFKNIPSFSELEGTVPCLQEPTAVPLYASGELREVLPLQSILLITALNRAGMLPCSEHGHGCLYFQTEW